MKRLKIEHQKVGWKTFEPEKLIRIRDSATINPFLVSENRLARVVKRRHMRLKKSKTIVVSDMLVDVHKTNITLHELNTFGRDREKE